MTSKPGLEQMPAMICHESGDAPGSAEIAARLGAEVAATFGPRDERPLSILCHDSRGGLAGGLNGSSHWGWLYIRNFWVAEGWRGRGLGRSLMARAETEARARNCVGLYLDTFNPQAVQFYQRCGFESAGRIANFPPGHARTFLRKALLASNNS